MCPGRSSIILRARTSKILSLGLVKHKFPNHVSEKDDKWGCFCFYLMVSKPVYAWHWQMGHTQLISIIDLKHIWSLENPTKLSSLLRWLFSWTLHRPFHHSIRLATWAYVDWAKWPLSHFLYYEVHSFVWHNDTWPTVPIDDTLYSHQLVVLAEVFKSGKANPYPKYVPK